MRGHNEHESHKPKEWSDIPIEVKVYILNQYTSFRDHVNLARANKDSYRELHQEIFRRFDFELKKNPPNS